MRLQQLAACAITTIALTACATSESVVDTRTPASETPTTVAGAPAVTQGIERYMGQRARVESVGFRLRHAAVPECKTQGGTKPDLGIIVWSIANFPNAADQAKLKETYGLGSKITVAISIDGGPARRAGLQAGNEIIAMNGRPMGEGNGATERFIGASNLAARDGTVTLQLVDGRTLAIQPDEVCDDTTLLVRSPDINAAADGNSIAITTGLFDITKSDDELALILGHELAHNTLGHLGNGGAPSSRTGKLIDAMMKAVMLQQAAGFSPAKEKEADYIGLYFMARAGFDVSAAEKMWTRLNRMVGNATLAKTHPSGPERLAALKGAITEIRAKQKAGVALTPRQ
jgi:hypothetical protein